MDSFPIFFFYESIFLIVFPFRNVTLIQFSLESRIGRGGFITSSKVDINVLELWVRLFLNGRGGRIRLRLRPSRRFVRRNHRPLKISRNRHAFNPSSNGQPLPRTQLKLPIISERILNYLAFETSDSSFVLHVDSWTILYHRTSRNWYQRNIFKSSDDFTLRSSFSSTSKKKKKRNVSLPNRLARNFSNIIQQPNEGFVDSTPRRRGWRWITCPTTHTARIEGLFLFKREGNSRQPPVVNYTSARIYHANEGWGTWTTGWKAWTSAPCSLATISAQRCTRRSDDATPPPARVHRPPPPPPPPVIAKRQKNPLFSQ